mmetsp:Transcript_41867/g.103051  ORF Transcript_41867/g.103051 Transcript_41867/m.103051 type:complete len:286 (+) Transcript_41867:168-1025(+)
MAGTSTPAPTAARTRRSPSTATAAAAALPYRSATPPARALESAFRDARAEDYRRGMTPTRYTVIARAPYRILVTDAPAEDELVAYTALLKRFGVKHVVRVCEATYDANELVKKDFKIHDWPSPDGKQPPKEVISSWLNLLDFVFREQKEVTPPQDADASGETQPMPTIAIHCLHGLGRAPVLVAIALIELGMDPEEAVGLIRAKRRGAINTHQLQFLYTYQRRSRPSTPTKGGPDQSATDAIKAGGFLNMAKNALSRRGSYRTANGGGRASRPASPVASSTLAVE